MSLRLWCLLGRLETISSHVEEDSRTGIHGSGEREGIREMALSSTLKRLDWI